MLNNFEEYQKMSSVESSHWWYKSLHNLVLKNLLKFLPDKESRILDAGCGSGGLISFLNQNKYLKTKGFDLSSAAVKLSKRKKVNIVKGDIKNIDKIFSNELFDAIISNDTLYFLSNEEISNFIDSCSKSIKFGGLLILNVPVFRVFSGVHDKAVGIEKRFTKKEINLLINHKDFRLVKKTFWPFFLSPIILFVRSYQRMRYTIFKNTVKSDIGLPNAIINNLLFKLTYTETKYIKKSFFGSSLFVVLQKK